SEGGGITKTYPFEIWRYAFIEGIGPDVEIEFVDPTNTGEFRMTIDPQEKDALLRAGGGPTEYEEAGLESRYLRLQRSGLATNYVGPTKDLPFERLARMAVLDKAPPLKFDKLREIVSTFVTYDQLPSNFRYRIIRQSDANALAMVNIEVPNSALSFAGRGEAVRAEVEIYGRIVDLSDRILTQFEDTLAVDFPASDATRVNAGISSIQKNFLLPPGTFRIDIALKDPRSNQIGTRQERMVIPPLTSAKLWAAPLILAHSIEAAGDSEGINDPYLLGTLRVRPQPALTYSRSDPLLVYLQLYGSRLDPSTQAPALTVRYNILKDGRLFFGQTDDKGKTVHFVSEQRVVLLASIPLATFEPGKFRLLVQATDRISGETTSADATFTVN
ncbi:MAG: hypothetical protein HXY20_12995, partial [Acidobacteria bacterium]|nr:hypothetical protein [Acidobacteriota bacterium]